MVHRNITICIRVRLEALDRIKFNKPAGRTPYLQCPCLPSGRLAVLLARLGRPCKDGPNGPTSPSSRMTHLRASALIRA